MKKTATARFWSKVKKTDGCWLWQGRPMSTGYGSLSIGPRGAVKQFTTHRFSYELHNGPIPKGLCVCHYCDVRACINPSHLFLGTKGDNLRDMAAKGRSARGEKSASAKLTEREVLQIRSTYVFWNRANSMTVLAGKFGVGIITIFDVIHRKTWRHI